MSPFLRPASRRCGRSRRRDARAALGVGGLARRGRQATPACIRRGRISGGRRCASRVAGSGGGRRRDAAHVRSDPRRRHGPLRDATRRSVRAAPDGCRTADPADGADWFGMSAAILAGDLAFVWADQMFDDVDEHLPAIVSTRGAVPVRSTADRGDRRAVSRPPNQRRTVSHRTRCAASRVAEVGAVHGEPSAADRRRTRRRGRPTV